MIRLHRVTKALDARNRVLALEDLGLLIKRGELVSAVGPSGSGKSTLLNSVGGLHRPTSDKIGFIFQFFNLLPALSCLEHAGELREQVASTIVIVTHHNNVAESCPRTVHLCDGRQRENIRR